MSVKKEITNFFQESFIVEPTSSIDKCLFFKSNFSTNLVRIIFKYLSSETGRAKTYKRLVPYQLAQELASKYFQQLGQIPDKKQLTKEVKRQDTIIRRAIKEVSESDIFLVSDCKDKGVLFFYPTEQNKLLFKQAKETKMKVDVDIQEVEKIIFSSENNIVTFPIKNKKNDSTPVLNDSTPVLNDSTPVLNDSTPVLNGTKSKMIDWSTFETDLEKAQEALFKEALFKESFIQEKELTEVSNEKKITSKENDLNDDKNNSSLAKEDSSKNDKQENSDLTKQKVIDQMTKTFIETCQKESSARAVPPVPVGPAGEKSQDVIELEDKLHSLGVKEEVYLKALGCHGYEKVKSIYGDMYKCLLFQKSNNLEPIRNKGLYLSQRLEKLDNPEIKLSFICNAYEESKVSSQDIVIVNDNEPKIYQNRELMNKVLNAISIKTFLSFKTSNNDYKAVEIVKNIYHCFEFSLKDPYSPESRLATEEINKRARAKNSDIPLFLPYEAEKAKKIAFVREFKLKFDRNELDLIIDLFRKFNSYIQAQKDQLNDFIDWFEGI